MAKKKKKKQHTFNDIRSDLLTRPQPEITEEDILDNEKYLEIKKQQFLSFNFKYLTNNSRYNFKYFSNDDKKCELFKLPEVCYKMCIINHIKVKEKQSNKDLLSGMKYKEIKHSYGDSVYNDDMPIIKIRTRNCRILCFSENTYSNVLYVLCFDWDYSCYKHRGS